MLSTVLHTYHYIYYIRTTIYTIYVPLCTTIYATYRPHTAIYMAPRHTVVPLAHTAVCISSALLRILLYAYLAPRHHLVEGGDGYRAVNPKP